MRVLMLRTVELRVGEREVRFEKNTHVDVSDEQGKALEADEAAIEENVPGHGTPAALDFTEEKIKTLSKERLAQLGIKPVRASLSPAPSAPSTSSSTAEE
jgi:hypothetical protein